MSSEKFLKTEERFDELEGLLADQEIVKDNENGIIVQNDRLAEAAEKLLHILSSEEKHRQLTHNARRSVRKIDWHEINARWLSQIMTVIQ